MDNLLRNSLMQIDSEGWVNVAPAIVTIGIDLASGEDRTDYFLISDGKYVPVSQEEYEWWLYHHGKQP